jgi:CPA1 family monovalent cation:H+ antiporter
LTFYAVTVALLIIVGRFFWVYACIYSVLGITFRYSKKSEPFPPWQYPFIVAWSGMRGGISLAAALAVPSLPFIIDGVNPRDLIIFLVFTSIVATLVVQGITLPWLIKLLGMHKFGRRDVYTEHLTELSVRLKMTKAALNWLHVYVNEAKEDPKIMNEVELYIHQYELLASQLEERVAAHDDRHIHDGKSEARQEIFILAQIIEVERVALLQLWHDKKINLTIRNRLLDRLDHRVKNLPI